MDDSKGELKSEAWGRDEMNDDQTIRNLEAAIARQPRVSLAHLPTALEEAPRLSKRLSVRVLIKRDDQTGLALGGNKVRKLEFLIADALVHSADTIVTTGGSQSNHARITAAACRRFGLDCYLVLDRGIHPEPQGNLLLDRLLGAHVSLIESADPAAALAEMDTLANRLRAEGRAPYVIPRGGSVPAGATGYAALIPELLRQLAETDIQPTYLYLGTGSTGTHSGTLAGMVSVGMPFTVQGISVSRPSDAQVAKVIDLTEATLQRLGLPSSFSAEEVRVDDRFRGPGYGQLTPETVEAIEVTALDEGVVLDPVYTGKAMAGLMGHAREGRFNATDVVIFLHTGGSPALFAYNAEMTERLQVVTR